MIKFKTNQDENRIQDNLLFYRKILFFRNNSFEKYK